MPVGFAQGTFTKDNSGTTNATQLITTSFQVKALICWSVKASALGVYEEGLHFAYGMSDGVTSKCWAMFDKDNVLPTLSNRSAQDAVITFVDDVQPTPNVISLATVTFGGSTGFTLTWAVNNTDADIIHYIAIGGTSITNTKLIQHITPLVTGNLDITGAGFTPDFAFFSGRSRWSGSVGTKTAVRAGGFIGYAKSAIKQAGLGVVPENANVTATDQWRTLRTDICINHLQESAGTALTEGQFVAFTADGCTINWLSVDVAQWATWTLFIKGGQWDIGEVSAPTSGTLPVSQTVNNSGFLAEGLILLGHNAAKQVNNVSIANCRISLGAGKSSSDQSNSWVGDLDLQSLTTAARQSLTNKIARAAIEAPIATNTVLKASADLTSINPGNFILSWDTVDNSLAHFFVYVMVGNVGVVNNVGFTENISLSDGAVSKKGYGRVIAENTVVGSGSMIRKTQIVRTLGENES